jgi:predicted acetyltransferase
MKTKNRIKIIPKKDYAAFVNIVANAYPGMDIITPEDKKKTIAKLKRSSSYPTVDYYGLYRENTLAGVMALYDFTMNLFTNMVKIGGIGLVAVDLLHKKEHICKEMVYFFLEYFKKKGVSLTALYPFRPDFYRNMGFGIGTKITQYTIKPKDLICSGAKRHIYHMGLKDRKSLEICYNRFVKTRHGMLSARPNKWLQVLNAPGVRIIGYKKANKVSGYLIFTFKKTQDNNWIKYDIIVRELICENKEAFNELISFLQTQYDQIDHIVLTTHDEYFHYSLHDPRDGTDNILIPLAHQTNTQGIGIMYRVINTKLLFKILKNHNFNDQTCEIKINIKDTFFKPNDTSIILHIKNGKIKDPLSKKYDVEIWLDVADFSSLIMGAVNFHSLYKYGLADISSKRFIDLVNKLFSVEQKPMSTTQF